MKLKSIVILTAMTAALSSTAFAKMPNWNYGQIGFTQLSIDDASEDPQGFNIAGSYAFDDNFFVRGNHVNVSEDVDGFDLDVDFTTIGAGWKTGLTDTSEFYVMGSYERIGLSASYLGASGSDSGNGFGGYVGVKSMLTDNFEMTAEIGYIDINEYDISDVSFEVTANYHFTEQFSVGAGYKMFDDFDMMSITGRYSF